MQFKDPKNTERYNWTNHVKDKMMYYGISESLIKRIVRFPKRVEGGVAENTLAAMQPTQNKKNPQEVWVMYQTIKSRTDLVNSKIILAPKLKIISAWRYPGVSPKGGKIPIPDEILTELSLET